MSGQIMWGKFCVVLGLMTVGGWGLMRLTTPSEEKLYQALAPDLKAKVDQIRAQREASSSTRDKLQAAGSGDKDQIVWAEQLGSTRPPGGRRV